MGEYLYFDTSALVKLVRVEVGSQQVRNLWIEAGCAAVASELVITELLRSVRHEDDAVVQQARNVIDALSLIEIDRAILESAARLDPSILRSLDAIHLATALQLGSDLAGVVTFDERMAEAARTCGLTVLP